MSETCNVEIRSSDWEKLMKSEKHLLRVARTKLMKVLFLEELALGTMKENNKTIPSETPEKNP